MPTGNTVEVDETTLSKTDPNAIKYDGKVGSHEGIKANFCRSLFVQNVSPVAHEPIHLPKLTSKINNSQHCNQMC